MLGEIAATSEAQARLCFGARPDPHNSAKGIPIGRLPDKAHGQPVSSLARAIVAEQRRPIVEIGDEHIDVAVVVEIGTGDTAADIGAAHAAGVACWSVLGGTHDEKTLRDAGSDTILGGISELPAALGRRFGSENGT